MSGASLQSELAHSLDGEGDQSPHTGGLENPPVSARPVPPAPAPTPAPLDSNTSLTISISVGKQIALPPEIQESPSQQLPPQEESLEPPKKRAPLSTAEMLEEKEVEVALLQDEVREAAAGCGVLPHNQCFFSLRWLNPLYLDLLPRLSPLVCHLLQKDFWGHTPTLQCFSYPAPPLHSSLRVQLSLLLSVGGALLPGRPGVYLSVSPALADLCATDRTPVPEGGAAKAEGAARHGGPRGGAKQRPLGPGRGGEQVSLCQDP